MFVVGVAHHHSKHKTFVLYNICTMLDHKFENMTCLKLQLATSNSATNMKHNRGAAILRKYEHTNLSHPHMVTLHLSFPPEIEPNERKMISAPFTVL